MNKLENFLSRVDIETKNAAIRLLVEAKDNEVLDKLIVVKETIEEFSKLFPKGE